MELTEQISSINRQLIDLFGIDISGMPIWRVVWSEDQYEKRLMEFNDSGLSLIQPEVRLVPKYKQWIVEKYVLEQLVVVPIINENELPTSKLSYEPLYVFQDNDGNYLPPKLILCKLVIDSIYAARGKSSLAKYKDPGDSLEMKQERVNELMEAIYGNETDVSDALTRREGIVVPSNYKVN